MDEIPYRATERNGCADDLCLLKYVKRFRKIRESRLPA